MTAPKPPKGEPVRPIIDWRQVRHGNRAETMYWFNQLELYRDKADAYMDWATAEIARLEAVLSVLDGSACKIEMASGNGPCGVCKTCLRSTIARLEAGREEFAREVVDQYLVYAIEMGSVLLLERGAVDRAIAAVKAREGK